MMTVYPLPDIEVDVVDRRETGACRLQISKPETVCRVCIKVVCLEDGTTDSDSHTSNGESNHAGWSKDASGTISRWSWGVSVVGGSVRARNWDTRGNGDSGGSWYRIFCDGC